VSCCRVSCCSCLSFDLCVASTTFWLNLTPLLRSFGGLHQSVRTNLPESAVFAASCALVFLAEAASNFFLLSDFCGVHLGGMTANKNPGGSLNCVFAVAKTRPSKWLSTIGNRHLCACCWYHLSSSEPPFFSRPCPFMDLGKMLKEKLRSYLNLTGTPQMVVPYVFVELRFRS
jgi:hypothetical protein